MKKIMLLIIGFLALSSCKTKQVDPATLPKDIALKPERENGNLEQQELAVEAERLRSLLTTIDSLATSRTCTDTEDWRISPIGSKPCGGPAAYMAYHKETEEDIIPKIQDFTKRQADYNRRRNLFSDCAVEAQPSGLRCEGGKPVLIKGGVTLTD